MSTEDEVLVMLATVNNLLDICERELDAMSKEIKEIQRKVAILKEYNEPIPFTIEKGIPL